MALQPEARSSYAGLNPTSLNWFLTAALSAYGTKYVWGGTTLRGTNKLGVDCSGLVFTALRYAGFAPPRTARELSTWTQNVSQRDARVGDLVFWDANQATDDPRGRGAGVIDHTGIYLGNGMVLEASSGQKKVVIRKLWGQPRFGRIHAPQGKRYMVPLGNSGVTPQNLGQLAPGKIPSIPAPGPEGEQSTNPGNPANFPEPARLSAHATEKEIIDFVTENYGLAARGFLQIPELRKALLDSARAGVTGQDRALEYVHATKWWRDRTSAQRSWDVLIVTDPKEAADRVAKRKAMLLPLWEQYGVDENIDKVATEFERLEMNEAQLNVKMAGSLQAESMRTGLDAGTKGAADADRLMQIARQEFLTPVDRQTAESWIIKGIRQGGDIEGEWRSYLAGVASHRFGIDPLSGITPGDVLAPTKQAVAENLEIDPNSIDLLDPKYNELMQVHTDDGKYRPMTQAEAVKWARSQESFKTTKKAEQDSSNLAEALAKTFGKVG